MTVTPATLHVEGTHMPTVQISRVVNAFRLNLFHCSREIALKIHRLLGVSILGKTLETCVRQIESVLIQGKMGQDCLSILARNHLTKIKNFHSPLLLL